MAERRSACPLKAASELGLEKPLCSAADLSTAYRQRVMLTHPDRGGSAAHFRRVNDAYERLKQFNADAALGLLRERRYQDRYHAKTCFGDRITHVLSRPLGNLVDAGDRREYLFESTSAKATTHWIGGRSRRKRSCASDWAHSCCFSEALCTTR